MKVVSGLMLAKIVMLLILTIRYNLVSFGEKELRAEPQLTPDINMAKDDADVGKEDRESSPKPSADEKAQDPFLGLLDTPKLNPEKIEKRELARYLKLAEDKEQRLEAVKAQTKLRIAKLKKVQADVAKILDRLEEEHRFFAQTVQREQTIKEKRLEMLKIMYEKMEPKRAAPVFAEMDKELAVALMKTIKNKQVTSILQAMPSDKARELTEYFGRVGSAREYELLKEMNRSLQDAFLECQ